MPGPRTRARSPRSGTAVSVWSPFDAPKEQTFTLASMAEHGVEATVTMRAFTARESMAFRDKVTTEMIATDISNDRTILLGVMESRLVTSVVQDWSGFPATITREYTELEKRRAARGTRVEGTIVEDLDLTRVEHLAELGDVAVWNELVALARRVEPDPMGRGVASLEGSTSDDDEDDEETGEDDLDDEEEAEEAVDPPVRPSTRSPGRSTPPGGKAARPVQVVRGEVIEESTTASSGPRRTSRPAAK